MRFFALSLLLITTGPLALVAQAEPMPLTYSTECILQVVLQKKNLALDPAIPVPPLFVESTTPLKRFQDAVEPQWHMRPDTFLNVYVAERNEIYLLDNRDYYEKHGRFIDDSLAHELTHYVQVKYQHVPLNGEDDSLESDAVAVQTWFRETFMRTGKSPCAAE